MGEVRRNKEPPVRFSQQGKGSLGKNTISCFKPFFERSIAGELRTTLYQPEASCGICPTRDRRSTKRRTCPVCWIVPCAAPEHFLNRSKFGFSRIGTVIPTVR